MPEFSVPRWLCGLPLCVSQPVDGVLPRAARCKPLNTRAFAAWAGFTLFVLYGALIPFHLTTDRALILAHLGRISPNPLISPDTGRRLSLPDVAQNILLFLPFGLFGAWALAGSHDRGSMASEPAKRNDIQRRDRRARGAFWKIVLCGFRGFGVERRSFTRSSAVARITVCALLLSIVAEGLQLFTIDRVTSIADVGADTLGALIGVVAWYPLRAVWQRSSAAPRARALAALPGFPPFVLAALLVCLAAWQPFDVTLDVGNAIQKFHALRHDVWQRQAAGALIVDAIRYALFTLAATMWLRQAGLRRAGLWSAILGITAACGLEASEAAIESRMPGIAALLSHLAGVCAGAWLARAWPGRLSPIAWAGILAIASIIGAALEWPTQPLESMMLVRWMMELALMALTVGVAIVLARHAESRARANVRF
jgi:hypothetical protein